MTKELNPTRFDVLLGAAKLASESDSDQPLRVIVTASSDSIDLGIDRFMLSALEQMAAEFPGMTVFLDHRYAISDGNVFGSVTSAKIVERAGAHDLDLEIRVASSNPKALATYELIKSGIKLGVSVGVLVEDAEFSEQKVDGKKVLNIKSVKTLEASIVGIPANRRSWVQGALKAASAYFQGEARELLEKLSETITVSDGGKLMADMKKSEAGDDDEITGDIEQVEDGVDEIFVDAVWTTAYINNLKDSAFATILSGGERDDEGKTKPRSLRKLPHHDDSGKVDEPHLNNALSREPQTKMPTKNHSQAKAHLNRHKGKKGLALDEEFEDMTDEEIAALDPDFDASHFEEVEDASDMGKCGVPECEEDATGRMNMCSEHMDKAMKMSPDEDESDLSDLRLSDEAVAFLKTLFPEQAARDWYTIKGADETEEEDTAEVLIYDVIGGGWFGGVDALEFITALNEITASKINLRINSPGGIITDAIAIKNALDRHPATVTAYIDGMAASAASFVALGSEKVIMSQDAIMMIHEPWSMMIGGAKAFAKEAEILDKFANGIAKMYARKAGGTVEEWRAVMEEETWYTDQEAVDAGLADEVGSAKGDDDEKKKFAPKVLTIYKHAPESVKDFFGEVEEVVTTVEAVAMAEMVAGVTSLTAALRSAQSENENLRGEVTTKAADLTLKEKEITDTLAVFAEVMVEVNKILDTPMPRKITPEATFSKIADKYPWLDARIIAQMARDEGSKS